jgi:hypothetical protein
VRHSSRERYEIIGNAMKRVDDGRQIVPSRVCQMTCGMLNLQAAGNILRRLIL